MKLLTGTANLPLAEAIASFLGIELAACAVRRFADGEIFVEITENVRGHDVFVLQPTSSPANDHLMELLILIDALRRGSARRLTAVIPYFGYARQDRKTGPRTPISARLVANLLERAGADRILTLDLHAGQIQGFFNIPVDNLFAAPVFASNIGKEYPDGKNLMIVSPDVGGVVRARAMAERVHAELAIIDKRREKPGHATAMNVIGNPEGRDCILVDDIVDSARTLCQAAQALERAGAKSVSSCITHGVLSPGALSCIETSCLKKLVVTDSIAHSDGLERTERFETLSVAPLLGQAISNIATEKSVSSLFD